MFAGKPVSHGALVLKTELAPGVRILLAKVALYRSDPDLRELPSSDSRHKISPALRSPLGKLVRVVVRPVSEFVNYLKMINQRSARALGVGGRHNDVRLLRDKVRKHLRNT